MEVAIPCREGEDNPEGNHEQEEAEPSVTRDLAATPKENGVEGGAVNHPQRTRRPPPLFGLKILSLAAIWISPSQAVSRATSS